MIPTVSEERAMELRRPTPWRRASIVTQAVLFVLTCVGILALYWFADLLHLPKGVVSASASIALAELLIRRARFWRTGVESALWIGGLCAFIVSLPSSGKPEAILTFVAAAALSGWRLRNALFGVAALVLTAVYIIAKHHPGVAAAFAIALIGIACLAETRIWQRPSTEFLFAATLVVMPVAAYEAATRAGLGHATVIGIFGAIAAALISVGVALRLRTLLLSAAVAVAVTGLEIWHALPYPVEVDLIAAGAVVLLLASALMRALRGHERGFVLAREEHELDEALQIAAMLPLAAPTVTPAPHPLGGGGEFGGAGASGRF
ncbi:MAG TPA: hypothetical protein VKH35_16850 [Thermoanaerobaculia bacterium]|nr:hypothetical protein [Thermoanaerobaculia bacterium]